MPELRMTAFSALEVLRHPERIVGSRVLVVGDDLSSADAALLLADRGQEVTLRSPAKDICFDSHPGFRRLNREALTARGGKIEVRVAADLLFDGCFDVVVVGRIPAEGSANPLRTDDAPDLADAYEPGAMTQTVYAAVDFALAD